MNIQVNGRTVRAPWPASRAGAPHGCFGRPYAHPITECEHLMAYFQALDSSEASEHWEALVIRMYDKVA